MLSIINIHILLAEECEHYVELTILRETEILIVKLCKYRKT